MNINNENNLPHIPKAVHKCLSLDVTDISTVFQNKLTSTKNGKALRKHWLHVENSSFGFIEAVHQR